MLLFHIGSVKTMLTGNYVSLSQILIACILCFSYVLFSMLTFKRPYTYLIMIY